jgi:soluble lytic murein transglycosylase-like protein
MSAPVEGLGPSAGGIGAASAAAARVAELNGMIEAVESGRAPTKSSFGAALAEATAVSGAGTTSGLAEASAAATAPTSTTIAAPITAALPAEATEGSEGAPPFAAQIEAASAKWGIDPDLLAGVIHQESNFDPGAGSPAGAQGLTQLMPETAAGLGVTNPDDPTQAIEGGARLLSEKLSEFGGNVELALAAYNAGSGAVHQYNGVPPYPETQAYVQKVMGYAAQYSAGGAFGVTA